MKLYGKAGEGSPPEGRLLTMTPGRGVAGRGGKIFEESERALGRGAGPPGPQGPKAQEGDDGGKSVFREAEADLSTSASARWGGGAAYRTLIQYNVCLRKVPGGASLSFFPLPLPPLPVHRLRHLGEGAWVGRGVGPGGSKFDPSQPERQNASRSQAARGTRLPPRCIISCGALPSACCWLTRGAERRRAARQRIEVCE